jgi:hypothetical protein
MKFFPPPTPLDFYSNFDPEECALRLGSSIDAEEATMFGFSGYRGSKPFVGRVEGKQFRVIQRVYSNRSSFPPVLTGVFEPEGIGTRVKGQFDLEATTKIAICLLDAFGLLVLILIARLSRVSHPVLLAVFVCGYGGLIVFSTRIFRGIGLDREKAITRFLKETLVGE